MAQGIKILYEGGVGELEEKKSRFIATTLPISSQEEALEFIEKTKKNDKGELVELGNHDELMTIDNGQYRALYEMQFKKQETLIV